MLQSPFSTSQALVNALGEHLRSLHDPYAGAHFRIAFFERNGLRFLTGCVLFQDRVFPARGEANYGSVLFAEEWVGDQWKALDRLSRLISGQEQICGHKVSATFMQSTVSRDFYPWIANSPIWRISSTMVKDQGWQDFYPPQSPLLGYGLKPYLSPNHAVNDWVFNVDHSVHAGTNLQDQWSLITILPDLRAKITSAEWLPGRLDLDLNVRIPKEHTQLQVLYGGSRKGYEIFEGGSGERHINVPADVQRLSIFLIDQAGDCLTQLHMAAPYECYGKPKSAMQELQQLKDDLRGGETDAIEFKPFTEANNSKEFDLVKTIVAFANTHGGRMYVGADDDGALQGELEACRIFKSSISDALAAQISRLKSLVREKIKPVPIVDVREVRMDGQPVIVAEVQRGNNPPYATHQNQVYVRKGATSRVADPADLRLLISDAAFH